MSSTRVEATTECLAVTARVAGSAGVAPSPDLSPELIRQASGERQGRPGGLSTRERQVMVLLADGFSTHEVAVQMSYSERTIKNILQDVSSRLKLRNRTHLVAHAIRNGWI